MRRKSEAKHSHGAVVRDRSHAAFTDFRQGRDLHTEA